MTCDVCGKEIPRGQRYKGKRYSSKHFCSEQCYTTYVLAREESQQRMSDLRQVVDESEEKTEYRKFMDLLNRMYPEENQNWRLFQQQATRAIENFELDYHKLRGIIVYAMKYESHIFNPEIALGQFFPRYIDPFLKFCEKLQQNREFEMPKEEEEIVINKTNRTNYNVKAVDF